MILVILGPTASHKSDLGDYIYNNYESIKDILFDEDSSKSIKIVNFDAFQVYKELNVGVAKPSDLNSDTINTKYLLYNIKSIEDNFDIKEYQSLGREVIKKYKDSHNLIFIGGSGLYIKSLLFNYIFLEEEDNVKKEEIESYLNSLTNKELYDLLIKLDYEESKKISINNRKRLLRCLFINLYYDSTKSRMNESKKDELYYKDIPIRFIFINPYRENLYKDINERVDLMYDTYHLKDEALSILTKYHYFDEEQELSCSSSTTNNTNNTTFKPLRSLEAIGYKEFKDYYSLLKEFNNNNNNNVIEVDTIIKERIKKNTRNYAKRQVTFFKHQFNSVYLNEVSSIKEAISLIEDGKIK